MDLKKVRAVLFDHDGTLVDSEYVHYQLWLETTGLKAEQFTQQLNTMYCVGIPGEQNAEFLIEQFDIAYSVAELIEKKHQLTQQWLTQNCFPAMPGASQVMRNFHKLGIRMSIVSGSERLAVDRSVEGNGFSQFLEFITTGEEVPHNKPAPDVYLKALQKLNLPATDCIAIEDTQHGVEAAVAAGVPCVAIPNEHSRQQNFQKADLECASLNSFYTHFIENR